MTLTLPQRWFTWVGVLAAIAALAALLTACGGGGDGGSAGADTGMGTGTGTGTDTGTGTGGIPTATVSITGPSRAVANTRYSYQASLPAVTNTSGIVWNWGDGSVDTTGSPVQKLWRKPGSFILSAQAGAGAAPVSASQGVAVVGTPLAAGSQHSCALQPSGTVLCWGDNGNGQLGNGMVGDLSTLPVVVPGLTDTVALAVGSAGAFTCALQAGGTARCWGANQYGQLGHGTTTVVPITSPVDVVGVTDSVALQAGGSHACAVHANGTVGCWGLNTDGQLGNANKLNSGSSVAVVGLTDTVALAAGANHSCALQASGTVRCWGLNNLGQLGNGTTADNTSTVSLSQVVALAAGGQHTCALQASGEVRCWGGNANGQLGNGKVTSSASPVRVLGLTDAVALVAGGSHTCAVKANGSAVCWGDNNSGQLGSGEAGGSISAPVAVASLGNVAALTAGELHTCALQTTGAMQCWGFGVDGALGNGTRTERVLLPTPVAGGAIFWK